MTSPSLAERIAGGQGPEFAELLETLGEAITVRDRDDRLVYANRAGLRVMGARTLAEVIGKPLGEALADYVLHDEDGRAVGPDALPSVRLMETGVTPAPLLVQTIDRRSGEARWQLLKVTPLRDGDGDVTASVTIAEDVTAVKAAEVHTRVLAESGRLLSASLDRDETLRNVADAALPGLADWCLVELLDGPARDEIVVAHVDPEMRPLAARLRADEPPEPPPESTLRQVIDTGRSVLHHEVSDAHLQRVAVSEDQLRILRELGIRSAMVVPMRVGGRIIGAMSFLTSVSRRRFTAEDLAIAEQLARRAAVAIDNSRLHSRLADVAETLQQSLLPGALPEVPGWEIGALYRPADADRRVEVGGDFYEVFVTGGTPFAMIGDVTGHGVAAAATAAMMRYGARFASHLEPDPAAIVRRLDEELRRRRGSALCTTLCAALHERGVTLCSAGHPPALIVDAAGTITEAPGSGPLLGAFPDSSWHQEQVPVGPGGLVLLYTDGVIEATGARDRFGAERLRGFLADRVACAPQALLDALFAELERFGDGPPSDDVAALALRPRPVI